MVLGLSSAHLDLSAEPGTKKSSILTPMFLPKLHFNTHNCMAEIWHLGPACNTLSLQQEDLCLLPPPPVQCTHFLYCFHSEPEQLKPEHVA